VIIKPNAPQRLRWYQLRLGVLLLLITFSSLIMSLSSLDGPRQYPGKAVPLEVLPPDPLLDEASRILQESRSRDSALQINMLEQIEASACDQSRKSLIGRSP
jgi:hypothetical protein